MMMMMMWWLSFLSLLLLLSTITRTTIIITTTNAFAIINSNKNNIIIKNNVLLSGRRSGIGSGDPSSRRSTTSSILLPRMGTRGGGGYDDSSPALLMAPLVNTSSSSRRRRRTSRTTVLFSTTPTKDKTDMETTTTTTTTINGDNNSNNKDDEDDKSSSSSTTTAAGGGDSSSLPWWWELVFELDIMKRGRQGDAIIFGDSAHVLRTNIEQIYGNYSSIDGCPLAEGEINDISDGTMFIGLQRYNDIYGSPYKLVFGPKSFLVVSDPIQCKHVLRDANTCYDKGVLAEILEPIMGKGLIPADPETWNIRRRQIVPAFHKAWLEHMIGLFAYCNQPLVDKLNEQSENNNNNDDGGKVEMETLFCSVALDIIGLSIFNYEFGSVTSESPIIKAVYSALVEAEHRSQTPLPYWDIIPFANQLIPRLRKFNADLKILNDILDDLINRAKNSRIITDLDELEKRNYAAVQDPSMLRFLVDMRGADVNNKQLRDDLMTMLIAGHETTAAVLTWALYELVKNPDCMNKVQTEIDTVLGDRMPTYDDIYELQYLRLVIAETLRLYPEPPLLIRRCRTDNTLPKGGGTIIDGANVIRGMDMFISIYNLHHDGRFWPEPDIFKPERFLIPYKNPNIPDWDGYDPERWIHNKRQLYPNEISSDFAYLPFGGGARKCVGDEFATLEATVTLAIILRRFQFQFDTSRENNSNNNKEKEEATKGSETTTTKTSTTTTTTTSSSSSSSTCKFTDEPYRLDHPVGMRTGATIHTRNGLHMIVRKRDV